MSTPAAVAPRLRGAFRRWGLLAIGGVLVAAFVLSALFAPQVAPATPTSSTSA